MNNVEYYWNKRDITLDLETFTEALSLIGALLPDPLEGRVDTHEYAKKLIEHAEICCAYDSNTKKIVGLIAIYTNDTVNFISFVSIVGVLKEYHGLKIGTHLLVRAIEFARNKKMKEFVLNVHKENKEAISFYNNFDFKLKSESENKWIISKTL